MTQPHFIYNNKVYYKLQDIFPQLSNFNDFQSIHYNVYDDTFLTSTFWKEPSHSLEYYLKERVLELKESYNKLRLICSGGYDTYVILLEFLKHNIHLDEIVFLRTDWSNTNDYYADYEYNTLFLPLMETYKTELYHTKIKTYDPDFSKVFTLDREHGASYLLEDASEMDAVPSLVQILHEKEYLTEHANIWGMPKAVIHMTENNQFFFSLSAREICTAQHIGNHEYFWISPTNITLFLKQLHLLKNYFEEFKIIKGKSDGDDLVAAQKIPYFSKVQALNLSGFYWTDNPAKVWSPFYRGKNYLRLKAALKHEHSRKYFDVWKEFHLAPIKKHPYLLNYNRTQIRDKYSNFYSLERNIVYSDKEFFQYNKLERFRDERFSSSLIL